MSVLDVNMPPIYLQYQLVYSCKLPLDAIAEAGKAILPSFDCLSGPNPFEIVDYELDVPPAAPTEGLAERPFFALLGPCSGGRSSIVAYFSHLAVDAFSISTFLQTWAKQYKGEEWTRPVVDTTLVDALAGTEARENTGYAVLSARAPPSGPPVVGCAFSVQLSREQLLTLRGPAKGFTCNDLRMALTWKAFVACRRLSGPQPTAISWAVNIRNRCDLPPNYFGNASIMSPLVEMTAEEVNSTPVCELAKMLRLRVVSSTSSDQISSTIAYLQSCGRVAPSSVQLFNPNPTRMCISDWSRYDFQPAFEGIKPSLSFPHAFWPIGATGNTLDDLYVSVFPDEVDEFKKAIQAML
eukprot:m.9688 g.9688  ORF g.9688 m.9688 type:complete len:353 (-) comp5794_c0_seq1:85-1143(-)